MTIIFAQFDITLACLQTFFVVISLVIWLFASIITKENEHSICRRQFVFGRARTGDEESKGGVEKPPARKLRFDEWRFENPVHQQAEIMIDQSMNAYFHMLRITKEITNMADFYSNI